MATNNNPRHLGPEFLPMHNQALPAGVCALAALQHIQQTEEWPSQFYPGALVGPADETGPQGNTILEINCQRCDARGAFMYKDNSIRKILDTSTGEFLSDRCTTAQV